MSNSTPPPPPPPPSPSPAAQPGGARTDAGSNYGDFAPDRNPAVGRDPSKGAEMERDSLPPDADFGQRPAGAETSAPRPPVQSRR